MLRECLSFGPEGTFSKAFDDHCNYRMTYWECTLDRKVSTREQLPAVLWHKIEMSQTHVWVEGSERNWIDSVDTF